MAVPTPVAAAVNPNDPTQWVSLWGNGRIDAHGGALPVTDGPSWYDRIDQPIAQDIVITDWSGPSGYVFDFAGGFHPFGGAPVITTLSGDTWVNSNGLPYLGYRWYHGISMDPSNTGQGYACTLYGELVPFGGATTPPRTGPRFTAPVVKGFTMRWTPDKRAYMVDLHGAVWADFAAVVPDPPPAYFPRVDVARDLAVSDWATGSGYMLTADGATHAFGSAASPLHGGPYRAGADLARVLIVVSASDPTRLRQVHAGGEVFDYVASTPPTATAGGADTASPPATVTDTTRPVLSWSYSDPQQDSQAAWELPVFTQAYVTANPALVGDPAAHTDAALIYESGINPGDRGITCPIDLPNGDYVMFVRVQDTAGQWSEWDDHAWTQNVPVPAPPTGLTATANAATATVALSVTATTGGVADLVRFECSDDAGATWMAVDVADAVPIATTTTAVDRFPPQGKTRTYRAVAYSIDPRTASTPSGTANAAVPVIGYLLHATDDPNLGGRIKVQAVDWVRTSTGGVFSGLDADWPTVVKDGSRPRAARANLELMTMDAAAWAVFEKLALSRSTLVFRGPFGDIRYCEIVGDWGQSQVRAAPTNTEATPLRHMHTTSPQLVEVRPPHLAG